MIDFLREGPVAWIAIILMAVCFVALAYLFYQLIFNWPTNHHLHDTCLSAHYRPRSIGKGVVMRLVCDDGAWATPTPEATP